VPWQRVINAQGKISPRGIGEREPLYQRHLLEKEGIKFDGEDCIDLRRYGWEGPSD
jgi:methylated-DNA-protein-cysteine methyltransferase-like protein